MPDRKRDGYQTATIQNEVVGQISYSVRQGFSAGSPDIDPLGIVYRLSARTCIKSVLNEAKRRANTAAT